MAIFFCSKPGRTFLETDHKISTGIFKRHLCDHVGLQASGWGPQSTRYRQHTSTRSRSTMGSGALGSHTWGSRGVEETWRPEQGHQCCLDQPAPDRTLSRRPGGAPSGGAWHLSRAHLAPADLMSMGVLHTPSWKQERRQLSAALTSGRPAQ